MPASTLSSSTWVSTDVTSGCKVTGLTSMWFRLNTFMATKPHGTCGWHTAVFTDDFDRFFTVVTWAGLLGGTATSMMFFANVVGMLASPAETTRLMFCGLAEANTSAGEPDLIWAARPELGPKLNLTVVPG